MKDHDYVELSPEFRQALDDAPRMATPSHRLERRMVRELRRRGLLLPERWAVTQHPAWDFAVRVAVSLVIFACGVWLGHSLGSSQPSDMPVAENASAWEMAALVQQTGSNHAEALRRLASRAATADSAEIELAREVAFASLRAALLQLALLDLSDPTPIRLLTELEATGTGSQVPVRAGNEPWLVTF